MPVSEATYKRVALEDPEGRWELYCGRLKEKPPVTVEHADIIDKLHGRLRSQLPEGEYAIRTNVSRLHPARGSYYVPDLFVVSRAAVLRLRERAGTFDSYDQPVPLVVEVWSRSTGARDLKVKIADYRRRGDLEIWRIHPYERTLTAWRRQSDGGYAESVHAGGAIQPIALPNVTIDLDTLYD